MLIPAVISHFAGSPLSSLASPIRLHASKVGLQTRKRIVDEVFSRLLSMINRETGRVLIRSGMFYFLELRNEEIIIAAQEQAENIFVPRLLIPIISLDYHG
jgi:hypothetical protein